MRGMLILGGGIYAGSFVGNKVNEMLGTDPEGFVDDLITIGCQIGCVMLARKFFGRKG